MTSYGDPLGPPTPSARATPNITRPCLALTFSCVFYTGILSVLFCDLFCELFCEKYGPLPPLHFLCFLLWLFFVSFLCGLLCVFLGVLLWLFCDIFCAVCCGCFLGVLLWLFCNIFCAVCCGCFATFFVRFVVRFIASFFLRFL